MKKIKYMLYALFLCFLSLNVVNAAVCTEEITRVCTYDKYVISVSKDGTITGTVTGRASSVYSYASIPNTFTSSCPDSIYVFDNNNAGFYTIQVSESKILSTSKPINLEEDNSCEYNPNNSNPGTENGTTVTKVCNYIDYKITIFSDNSATGAYTGSGTYNYNVIVSGGSNYGTNCADTIYVVDNQTATTHNVTISKTNMRNASVYKLNTGKSGYTNLSGNETSDPDSDSSLKSEIGNAKLDTDIDFNTNNGCTSYLGPVEKGYPAYYLQFVFNLIKYAAIILLFILTIIDFAKATASKDNDAIKKAIITAIKRLIIAIVIFILPILIEFLFKLLGIYDSSECLELISK